MLGSDTSYYLFNSWNANGEETNIFFPFWLHKYSKLNKLRSSNKDAATTFLRQHGQLGTTLWQIRSTPNRFLPSKLVVISSNPPTSTRKIQLGLRQLQASHAPNCMAAGWSNLACRFWHPMQAEQPPGPVLISGTWQYYTSVERERWRSTISALQVFMAPHHRNHYDLDLMEQRHIPKFLTHHVPKFLIHDVSRFGPHRTLLNCPKSGKISELFVRCVRAIDRSEESMAN